MVNDRGPSPALRVFISYRRADSPYIAGRLRERLAQAFGAANVFFDVESIDLGSDFQTVIRDTVGLADVVVVVIGARFDPGRLLNPNDIMRLEIVEALAQDKLVVPVLVERANLPNRDEVPPELAPLCNLQAAELRSDPDFERDTMRLVDALRRHGGNGGPDQGDRSGWLTGKLTRRNVGIAGAIGLVLALVVMVALRGLAARTDNEAPDRPNARDEEVADTGGLGDADPSCQGESNGTLTIGGLLPRTGDQRQHGPARAAAATLAVTDINEAGGVLSREVEFLDGDSGDGDPDVATQTVEDHINAGADVLVEAVSDRVTFDVIDRVVESCRIQFSSSATASSALTDYDDDDLFFRTAPSNALQGQALAELALEEGGGAAAILYRRDGYGEKLAQFITEAFEGGGGEISGSQAYDPEADDFDAEVQEVMNDDPDVLFMVGYSETAQILQGLFDEGFSPEQKRIYLVDGNVGDWFGGLFTQPGALSGISGTLPGAAATDNFRQRLQQIDPGVTAGSDYQKAPETYDAVVVAALAALAAGTEEPAAMARQVNRITREGETCTSFAECADLIAADTDIDYDGLSGPLEFSQPGEPTTASYAVLVYGNDNRIDSTQTAYRDVG